MGGVKNKREAQRLLLSFGRDLKRLFGSTFRFLPGALEQLSDLASSLLDPEFRGFLPGEEAALRARSRERTVSAFDVARQRTASRSFILGGREVPSGALLAQEAGLSAGEAAELQRGQQEIDIEGGRRRFQGIQLGANILSGVTQIPLQLSQQAIGAFGAAGGIETGGGFGSILNSLAGGGAGSILAGLAAFCAVTDYLLPQYVPTVQSFLLTHGEWKPFTMQYIAHQWEWRELAEADFIANVLLSDVFGRIVCAALKC